MTHANMIPAGFVQANSPERIHALDAARTWALLLGIVLHATMSFFLPIPAQDVSQSTSLSIGFYVIHVFRMSLFFLIAGFFAHMLFHRRGLRAFVKDRAKRIVAPMTAGWLVLAPTTIALVIWGFARTFPDGLPEGFDPSMGAEGLPLTHLWFLYYLCIFYVLTLSLRWILVELSADRFGLSRVIDRLVRVGLVSYLAPLALAIPLFALLYLDTNWAVWFGLPTPGVGLMPQAPALAGYGLAFALGWLLHRQIDLLNVFRRQWLVNLVVGAGLTVLCLAIVGVRPNIFEPTLLEGGAGMRAIYAGAYTLSIWYWTFGLVGAALRFCTGESPTRRYLADASYWLYLAHIPIVFGLQVLLMHWAVHWAIKFPLIITITMAVLLVSYHYLVRPTWLGAILNGRKVPRRPGRPPVPDGDPSRGDPGKQGEAVQSTRPPGPSTTNASSQSAVAALAQVSKRYGKEVALDALSLEVQPGELLAVLGPNGAGKTTAIEIWLGTIEADKGRATIVGGCPSDPVNRLDVGMMLQEVQLAPMLSGREHVVLASSYYRDPMSVDDAIALAGIGAFSRQRLGKLSAGQKRQVQFAVAICGKPRLLFLDEPTVGLDIQARETMWRTIRGLVVAGCSIVLTTHYLEEAEALADRVAVLAAGRLIAEGSVAEMRALVARRRISCISLLDVDELQHWPGVVEVVREAEFTHLTTTDPEALVRRLLDADPALSGLEVRQASLAEAFKQLTREDA